MKKFTKSIIGLSLVTIMAFATSCGSSVKDDAVAALDTVIANGAEDKPFLLYAKIADSTGELETYISKDAAGNAYLSLVANGSDMEIYSIDGEVYMYADGIDASAFIDEAAKETYNTEVDAAYDEYLATLQETRDSIDTAFLVEAVEEGDNYVINATAEEGGAPVVLTIAKDGSKYTYNDDAGMTEELTFSDDITVALP